MIANDPYAELERRFARLSAVNRAWAPRITASTYAGEI